MLAQESPPRQLQECYLRGLLLGLPRAQGPQEWQHHPPLRQQPPAPVQGWRWGGCLNGGVETGFDRGVSTPAAAQAEATDTTGQGQPPSAASPQGSPLGNPPAAIPPQRPLPSGLPSGFPSPAFPRPVPLCHCPQRPFSSLPLNPLPSALSHPHPTGSPLSPVTTAPGVSPHPRPLGALPSAMTHPGLSPQPRPPFRALLPSRP